ncbi:MAG: adenine nucleotide alpha hydrolase [Proteobacteria bacterium]|nr:adenine nucleotide alpha hydrolase [Pseudomonadota bacterium]
MTTPVLMAWSGGKDSTLALERLLADPQVRVTALLTTVTQDYDRVAMHGVRRSILHRQAAALGLPLIEAEIAPAACNESYGSAMTQALVRAREREPALQHCAFGDLYLADVRAYREAMLGKLGWRALFPLWGQDTQTTARYFIERGYRAILSCVDTQQLGAGFCGRDYDAALLAELPAACDPCGENGEFHTCVHAGPIFSESIPLFRGERALRDERFQYVDLIER